MSEKKRINSVYVSLHKNSSPGLDKENLSSSEEKSNDCKCDEEDQAPKKAAEQN